LFNQNRLLKHQVLTLYGYSLRKLLTKKLVLDKFFLNSLIFLELRLSVLAFRVFFYRSLLEVIKEIKVGNICVNNRICHKNYLVRVGDIIGRGYKLLSFKKQKTSNEVNSGTLKSMWYGNLRKKKGYLKYFRSYKYRNSYLNRILKSHQEPGVVNFFKKKRLSLVINFVESHYRIKTAILLYKPVIGEILLVNKKRMLSSKLLKKIYFLY